MVNWVQCEKCGITENANTLSEGVCQECLVICQTNSTAVANKVTPLRKLSISLEKLGDKVESIVGFIFSDKLGDKLAKVINAILVLAAVTFIVKILILTFNSTEERYSLIHHYLPDADVRVEPTKYSVINGQLISDSDGNLRNLSEDRECVVMNRRNWRCSWKSYVMPAQSVTGETFENAVFEDRMVKGDYSVFSNAWTAEYNSKVNELSDVSLLRYTWNSCKRHFKYDFFDGLIYCPLQTAFYYP